MIAPIFTQGCRPMLAAMLSMLVSMASQAQVPQPAANAHDVTVVTLYSEFRPAPGTLRTEDKPERPPIQIVGGGVKSAGPSCWDMDESGQIVPVAGECYVLRSAAPGEKPPVRQ
ncbi:MULTISPECIES: hypothetical protein [Ralstonia]|jgi:hypothetical protein|uniref:Uncharacterized protein n=3 Tax=Pseudomonadota TaxID=1224 RepID=A0AAD2BTJ4_9RALS|nr:MULTISPECIES: hypothetical protein [Ralstonia]NOZ17894.1 hypothetical protein [Betaproteobacteria bacterium]MBA9871346.1 hypothetical protein [Ralstonia insidiosa]MBB0026462.1 hypothetical protein [Ralstonia pickettii]MBB0037318.1 hypothetical protein [Ralstonia pickettii]MBB0109652.1 hypothetical protein [Ralstonia pickettii]